MSFIEILEISLYVLSGVITTLIPCIIAIKKTINERNEAKTYEEYEAAKNDMLDKVNDLIAGAELTYKNINDILKQQGSSAGPAKKDSVLTKLQAYALEQNYIFDFEYWSAKIDEIVKMTREVNSK